MKISNNKTGFTLVEVIVGIALIAIVFSGIFGAYRLSLKVVSLSKNKITATAIANEQIEIIRNLPYASVGTSGAILPRAAGVLSPSAVKTLDGITFTVETKVRFVTDELQTNGTLTSNPCGRNYKSASVVVSWKDVFPGNVTLSTIAAPKSIVEEVQTCSSQPGGVLTVTVFDSHGVLVNSPMISIYDIGGTVLYDTAAPTAGFHSFPLAVGAYRVAVTKNGYSSARSYGTNEISTPDTSNPTVLIGENVPVSLSIDKLSTVTISTISPTGQDNFADSFADQAKISLMDGTQISAGSIVLAGPPYSGSGFAISNTIAPPNLVSWDSFNFFGDSPAETEAKYQILYFDGASWILVPDQDLGGNSAGFSTSPINLSGLNISVYPQLKIKGMLFSSDPASTPACKSWQILWTTNTGVPVPGMNFHMRGGKTLGKNSAGEFVYKYEVNQVTDGSGQLVLQNIEGDTYDFSSYASSTMALVGTDPAPQPVSVPADGSVAVKLYMRSSSALLITVQDDQNLLPLFSAAVEIKDGLGYDKTRYTDQKGQTYFAPLADGSYTLNIQTAAYDSYSGSIQISGQTVKLVNIHQTQ